MISLSVNLFFDINEFINLLFSSLSNNYEYKYKIINHNFLSLIVIDLVKIKKYLDIYKKTVEQFIKLSIIC